MLGNIVTEGVNCLLSIQVGLNSARSRVGTAVNKQDLVTGRAWEAGVLAQELAQILLVGAFAQVTGDTNGGLARVGAVVAEVVKRTKARWVYSEATASTGLKSRLMVERLSTGLDVVAEHAHVTKHSGGLNHGDGVVEVLGQLVLGGAESVLVLLGVVVDSVLGVEHLLRLVQSDSDGHETVGDRASLDTVRLEPSLNSADGSVSRGSQSINLLLGHVLAVVGVVGVADLHQAVVKLVKVLLLKTNVHVDSVLGRGLGVKFPSLRHGLESRLDDHVLDNGGGCHEGGHQGEKSGLHDCYCRVQG